MTAEFAAVIPAVVLVLALCLGAIQIATLQLRLQDAAATAARGLARGEPARIEQLLPGATSTVARGGGLVCVTATLPVALAGGVAGELELAAKSCAAEQP